MAEQHGFESFDEGARLRRLSDSLEDPRWILTGIGALLVSASQRAFREERMGDVKWKTRAETGMVPNWPAIVGHFAVKSSAPPARYFGNAHTLTNTGRLRGSINFRVASEDTVEVGSNVPYAKALHEGDESQTPVITKALQERMWDWIKKVRGQNKKAKQRLAKAKKKGPEAYARAVRSVAKTAAQADQTTALGWLLNKKLRGERLTIQHPARPLVGLPKDIREEIAARYGARVRVVQS